jgi:hypothetical protein
MLTKVEMCEKENIQSLKSFAQSLEAQIKEVEQKLDRLVNAFLDGSVEKETYLAKKDELIKTKTVLLQKKDDFGRKGNNWIEPLKDWILTANYAEKLVSSNDFDEIKSFVGKIGTNRRLLDRKVFFDFVRPFDLIPKYKNLAYGKNLVFRFAQNKEICEASRAEGEASEQTNSPRNDESCIWSGCWELNPGH